MKWTLLFFFFSLTAFAQEIKILTWNTFLIPPPWNTTRQSERVRQMVEKLPTLNHDIMFFQETFFVKKRKLIIQALEKTHPHVVIPVKGKKLKQLQDSGLMIASRHPLDILGQVIFDDCIHSDCLASKSAILVEMTLASDKKIQLVTTHLQAWDDDKAMLIRRKQLQQVKNLMKTHQRPGIPQFIVGDLNMDGRISKEYPGALSFMEMTSTPLTGYLKFTNGFPTKDCFKNPGGNSDGQWLDHVWIKTNGSEAVVTNKKVLPIIGTIRSRECPLSDHYAVEALITL